VVLFDLDQFKRVNDEHGHKAGDEALRAFADVLRQNTRRMDLSARFGGEESLSILGDCELAPAVVHADRVRAAMAARTFSWGSVTVSAGVAAYEKGMVSYEVLVAAAARALCGSKQTGRNRVTGAVPQPTLPPAPSRSGEPQVASEPGPPNESGSVTVMLIDDDSATLRSVGKLLRRAGYRVEETDDAETVIRRFDEAAPPDLLITDVMMPRMNGLTLADRVACSHPGLRVIHLSGYLN
jgi:diguanylate cyclase (GGDEF)-like protein